MALSLGFLYVYCRTLGQTYVPVVPHLCLITLLIAGAYGHAFSLAGLRPRAFRIVALAGLSFLSLGTLAIYYAIALACLYGFRDLPTRDMVAGYLGQIPSLIGALPLDQTAVALFGGSAAAGLVASCFALAWCFEGLRTPPGSSLLILSPSPTTRRLLQLGAPLAFAVLLVLPIRWFLDSLEPLTRSVQSEPLLVRRVLAQTMEAGTSGDHEVESRYPTSPMGNRMNVVLIVIDAMRADVLEPYGGPVKNMAFVDSLVKHGKLLQYPRVFAACSFTLCGVGSMFGSRPAHRILPDDFVLPRVLKRQGYDLRYLLSGDHQHYLNLKAFYGQDIDFYLDGSDIDPDRSTNDIVVFNQLSRLPASRSVTRPQFFLLWLKSVHALGQRDSAFRKELPDRVTVPDIRDFARKSVEAYRNNYHNGVLQADWVIKRIWNWLQTNGYLDNSVVVITGDHGESLGEHGRLGHTRSLQNSEIQVPLWIHDPTGKLATRDFVFQTDIAPTILDLIALPMPATWEGSSLVNEPAREWNPIYLMNGGSQFGLIRYRDGQVMKYLLDTLFGYERIYDLNADPGENTDLRPGISPETLNEFRRQLRRSFGDLIPKNAP